MPAERQLAFGSVSDDPAIRDFRRTSHLARYSVVSFGAAAGLKSTVIVSPTFRMVFDQPARLNTPGGRPSICHSTLPPLPSSTDRKIHTWGLVHFHCVTVPLSTTTLLGSNAELLWCARTNVAASSTAMTKEQILICDPPR